MLKTKSKQKILSYFFNLYNKIKRLTKKKTILFFIIAVNLVGKVNDLLDIINIFL
jgi:hypothetical protein